MFGLVSFIIKINSKSYSFSNKEESMMTEQRHYWKLAFLFLLVPLVCMKVMWHKKMKKSEAKGEHMGYCMHGNRMGHCPECKKMETEENSPS